MDNAEFNRIWHQFHQQKDTDPQHPCVFAEEFLRKIEDIVFKPLAAGQTLEKIGAAKFTLQEEYHAWRRSVPIQHLRDAIGKHRCLPDVYELCYDRLHLLQLQLRPSFNPVLAYDEQPKQAPIIVKQPPPEYTGLYMGDEDDT